MEPDCRCRATRAKAPLVAMILLIAGCAGAARGPEPGSLDKDPTYHLRWAIEQYQRGRYKEALDAINRAIALNPEGYDLYNMRGLIYRAAGEPERSLTDFRKALEVNPYSTDAHNNLGAALADLGKSEEALAEFRLVLKDPKYQFREKAYLNIGDLFVTEGRLTEAAEEYRRAIVIKPAYVRAHLQLGKTLQALGQAEEARKSFDEVVRLAPQSDEAREVRLLLQRAPPSS